MDLIKLNKQILSGKQLEIAALAEKYEVSKLSVRKAARALKDEGYNVHIGHEAIQALQSEAPHKPLGVEVAEFMNKDGWFVFGACGDKHMGSRHHRSDVLNALYDVYASEGIKHVFDSGNVIDGEARFNFHELTHYGMEAQVMNFVENHPARPGMTTYFVCGDDHEGWYQQKLKMSIGEYIQGKAIKAGRTDLVYLGYMEADIEFRTKYGKAIGKVMHPGGGSAYAESYTQQKIAEAFSEGEKPHFCLIGHYHKALYGYHRGIHMLQTGCTQDQTSFMRKKRLKAALGGWIVRMHQAPKGHINRFAPEFIGGFYPRDFYRNRRQFDTPGNERGVITL